MTPAKTDEAQSILDLAVELARRAGAIQRERYETELEIHTKSEAIDLVTEVDRACEAMIIETLDAERPHDAVLAEEGGGLDRAGAEWRWVVDPLDGTTNYAHGYPRFCVSIGIEHRGEREVAVVYDPLLGELFTARRGHGAHVNGRALHVSTETRLNHALAATGFAYDVHKSPNDNLAEFARMIKAMRAVRRDGSAALDLCYVAAGRFEAFWEFKLHAWDVAAGILIVEEAGGRCTDAAGNPPPTSGAEIIATNGVIHDEVLALLRKD